MSDRYVITHLEEGNVVIGKARWQGQGAVMETDDSVLAKTCQAMTFTSRKGTAPRFKVERISVKDKPESAKPAPQG